MSSQVGSDDIAQAQAKAKQVHTQAKLRFTRMLQEAQKRLAYAESELKRVEGARDGLANNQAQRGGFHHTNMVLLAHVHGALRRMMQLQIEAYRHNLGLVSGEALPEAPKYRVPEEEVAYQEARAFFDLTTGMFTWIQLAEGIDLLLRATGSGSTVVGADAAEEAKRDAQASALMGAMADDLPLKRFVGGTGPRLAEVNQQLEWARGAMEGLRQAKGPDAKRMLLSDPSWPKLAGAVRFLGELSEKARAFPSLQAHFPEASAEALGFGTPMKLGGQLLGEA